jgi:hypothetical protein
LNNNNLVPWVLLAGCLLAGFISGWTIKEYESRNNVYTYSGGPIVRIHDTLKVPLVEYRIIPGTEYDVDSVIEAVNIFWKDSLKELYGKGLFEARFVKEDNIGKKEITLESRIPVDPEAKVIVDEQINLPEIYPVRKIGIFGGAGYENKNGFAGSVGVKYYVLDYKYFSLSGIAEGKYCVNNFSWHPAIKLETELRF